MKNSKGIVVLLQPGEFVSHVKLNIADLSISVSSADRSQKFEIPDPYDQFVANCKDTDLTLKAHFRMPAMELGKEIFSSGCWGLYANNGFRVFKLAPKIWGPSPIRLGVLGEDFRTGDIYCRDDYLEESAAESDKHGFPFGYPLDEMVILNILSQKSGIIVHACGISHCEKGYLFLGQSGAGKSTIVGLWEDKGECQVLSDDRIVIRSQNGRFYAYGTPWHGEGKFFSTEKVRLERIFFLKQGKTNQIRMLNPVDAASRLFICSFPTFYDAKGIGNTLDLINSIAIEVECYELSFVPEVSFIEFMCEHGLVC
jgi:hypothetical protein